MYSSHVRVYLLFKQKAGTSADNTPGNYVSATGEFYTGVVADFDSLCNNGVF